ncbi:hypothetical protein [Cytobacillus sp. IB215316]|uniref:hypothetical protein n=1 Tax=Cytobacillus sp. IB215316 TaxID=3097354 RepID=UPI002A0ACB58|nr:hypothetical protein [Cytobacillus sp. IB215316]MDX8362055.1 hypothetical protein [Cytobacillus sp. IB215316]
MKQVFAFEKEEKVKDIKDNAHYLFYTLKSYSKILEDKYSLSQLPKGVVWTSEDLVTSFFSNIPIPAFTKQDVIYMTPDVDEWKKLFIRQLEEKDLPDIRRFYNNLSLEHILVILAHELTHHSDLFLGDFDDGREDDFWFEEGMCFYIPRKHLLSEEDFQEIYQVESDLVNAFSEKYGGHSIEDFGYNSYEGSLASIMFDYWRSNMLVKNLVEERAHGDIQHIFTMYHNWDFEGRKIPLREYFLKQL